jgi:hypothetical protein
VDALRVTSLLLGAGESQWRKEVDVGPIQFDDGGMPILTEEQKRLAAAPKPRRFCMRVGGAPEIHVIEDGTATSANLEFWEEGPFAGASVTMGRRRGRLAFELGFDISDYYGEDWSTGTRFESTLVSINTGLVIYLKAGGNVGAYFAFGGRFVRESTDLYVGPETYYFENTGGGWGGGFGLASRRFDLRYEHVEVGSETRIGMDRLSIGLRF